MTKYIPLIVTIAAISCGGPKEEKKEAADQQAPAMSYVKGDLQKTKWIEGKWKGLYKGTPFYEIYRLTNDSTLEITSFDWNGKDSSKTTRSYVYFRNGAYYHGEKQNWVVMSITDSAIKMLPLIEVNNDILWRYKDSTNWEAILTGPKETVVYNMQYFDPFKK